MPCRQTPLSRFATPALSLSIGALLIAAAGDGFAQTGADRVERGRYLVNTSGCHDCHTPFRMGANGPEPDMGRMLSGRQLLNTLKSCLLALILGAIGAFYLKLNLPPDQAV